MPDNTETLDNYQGISVDFEELSGVEAMGTAYMNILLSGDNNAPAKGSPSYRIEAEGFTGSNAIGTLNLQYQFSAATPALRAQPQFVEPASVWISKPQKP